MHTITRFTAAKKHFTHPALWDWAILPRLSERHPCKHWRLSFSRFCWLHIGPEGVTLSWSQCIPYGFWRFHLASTGLCLLNSDAFIALSASKGSGASFQPWQNIHLYHWDEKQHSFFTAGSLALYTEVSLALAMPGLVPPVSSLP